MKICIPSKNRSSSIKTHLFFKPKDVLIFVEPQEVKRYKIFCPEYSIVDIEKSDQGITYVRNFITEYIDEDKLVIADDDINFFGVRNNDYRYDSLFVFDELLNSIEEGLNKYWGYNIPNDLFAYFMNRNTNQQRLFENNRYLSVFYGINLKKFKENHIRFDPLITDSDDIDISAQIILNNGNVCTDYKYALNHDMRSPGGLSDIRKINHFSLDSTLRTGIDVLAKKYGPEFIKMSRDEQGYLKSYYLDLQLLLKRKEIARKNYEEYLKRNSVQ